jgi:EAL domain-containing protein (putative c-di-GMP-specific phosphodiesterase class I)
MGMTTTAEGVENEHQMHVLLEEGCDQAQGFLFPAPCPPTISPNCNVRRARWGNAQSIDVMHHRSRKKCRVPLLTPR